MMTSLSSCLIKVSLLVIHDIIFHHTRVTSMEMIYIVTNPQVVLLGVDLTISSFSLGVDFLLRKD